MVRFAAIVAAVSLGMIATAFTYQTFHHESKSKPACPTRGVFD